MIHLSDKHGWEMVHIEVQNVSHHQPIALRLVGSQSSFSRSRQSLVSRKHFLCTLGHVRTIINYMLTTTVTAKTFMTMTFMLLLRKGSMGATSFGGIDLHQSTSSNSGCNRRSSGR
jgi:hypothetical protein